MKNYTHGKSHTSNYTNRPSMLPVYPITYRLVRFCDKCVIVMFKKLYRLNYRACMSVGLVCVKGDV